MKKVKIILFFVFLAGVLSTCKKYPNGPFLTFRTPKERLTTAIWALDLLEINGIDSTETFLAKPCLVNNVGGNFYFNDKKGKSSYWGGCGTGDWSFDNNYKNIKIIIYSDPGQVPPINPAPFPVTNYWIVCNIRKLTQTKLWIETNYSGIDYKMHFKRVGDN